MKTIKELANFKGDGYYLISLYLNVDGRKFPRKQNYERKLKDLLRQTQKEWLEKEELTRSQKKSLGNDFEAISQYVRFEFTRRNTKGLAIFSCSAKDFWQVHSLPVGLPSRLVVGLTPHTKPLASILDEYKRYCTVVVDRRRARIFTVYLGEIDEHSGVLEDDVPGRVKDGEWAGLRETKIAHHIEDHVHRHLKNIADKTLKFFKHNNFDHLIIGGHKETFSRFEQVLHSYLRERVAGYFFVKPDASLKKILEESLTVLSQAERREEEELISQLVNQAKPAGQGVTGLEPTLEALRRSQIQTLLISSNYGMSGRICPDDRFTSSYLENCPSCGKKMLRVDDLGEEIVEEAIKQDCKIEYVFNNEKFERLGGIGALLKFTA